nr:FCD domain-containing protein [Naumannella cuiyingiana]
MFEAVQDQLLELIADERLRAGDALPPEGELAVRLGVSRGSLREATRSLQSMGVLEARAGKGLFVQAFSLHPVIRMLPYRAIASGAELKELLELRAALERGLIDRVAAELTDDKLAELDAIVDEMDALERAGRAFPEQDRRFHRALYVVVGNRLVLDVLDTFWELSTRMRRELPPLRYDDLAERHRAIVRALRGDGDPVRAMDEHFTDIQARVTEMTSGEDAS